MRYLLQVAGLLAVLGLASSGMAARAPQDADDNPPAPQYALPPGYIGAVPLACYASDDLQTSCDDLVNERLRPAEVSFGEAYKKDRGNLIAWVGLMQSNTKLWGGEIDRARGQARGKGPDAAIARFKLGTLLFYRWSSQPAPAVLPETEPLPPGRQELSDAWTENKAIAIGMALVDTYLQNDHKVTADVVDRLLLDVVGADVQKAIRAAEQAKWQGDPPAVAGMPVETLRPLWGLARLLFGDANQRPRTRVKKPDGTVALRYDPISADMAQKAKYMKAWRTAIETELKKVAPQTVGLP